ncbi:NAD(P)H-hydrate dehydratase [Pseudoxanthomonas sp.]|uniref:NAD(P)H-hydrate dehydratase n=1 Tax=Pseudoxanthomonas sp. TaxID=1871049 RepID=UPI0026277273|nr:NAD(P)H-hydrate dehydratase [Pseudoxanthomonas sp.]WDS36430.1 MAG: NAD(P)H-hydrate dehydratase [Pseudoxanthomonas sp.]
MTALIPLHGSAAARALDEQASARLAGGAFELMQRAGRAAWQVLRDRWPQAQRITVICGPGNNGGDGYVLALAALQARREVVVLHLQDHTPRTGLSQRACTEYVAAGGRIALFPAQFPLADVVVDALFGIGLARAPEGEARELIEAINAQPAPVFALDVPSGIDASLAAAPGTAARAQATLQFIVRHHGLHTGAGLEHAGELLLDALGVPADLLQMSAPKAQLLEPATLSHWLRPRRRDTHKGESGRVLVIGGDLGHGGAIAMAAEAALRSGAGLVSVATRKAHVVPLLARRPEAMTHAVESGSDLQPLLDAADVIAIGPGLGQGDWGRALLRLALEAGKPLVLDADALNLIATAPRTLRDAIVTPHPGEAARLLGRSTANVQADRFGATAELCHQLQATVVLKGAGTLVASEGQIPRVIGAGNPGMATGGMGDVLTGVIAALRAQGLPAFEAASAGALLHSMAGDAAARRGQRGLLATDLFDHLQPLANPEPH